MSSPEQSAEAQAEQGIDGLRILARIIVRHCLKHPERDADRGGAAGASPNNQDRRSATGPFGRESDREEGR